MNYQILLRPEAEGDLTTAYRWYEEQRCGLGDSLLLHVDAVFSSIKRNPSQYPIVYKKLRRALVRRFPFGIFYITNKDIISILAVLHVKQSPHQWKKRN